MKRLLSLALIAILFVLAVFTAPSTVAVTIDTVPSAASSHYDIHYGDIDGNGKVDLPDVTALQLYLANIGKKPAGVTLTKDDSIMDANFDGETDIDDATILQRYLAKMQLKNADLDTTAYQWSDGAYVKHTHKWKRTSVNYHSGFACNKCFKDVTDWDDPYACHGGWHTHKWCVQPRLDTCSECGAKRHLHYWSYYEPRYYGDRLGRRGYYFCNQCLNFSENGFEIDNSIQRNCDNWVTYYDFSDSDIHTGVEYSDPMTDPLDNIQGIDIVAEKSLAVGDTSDLIVEFTPAQTRCDRTIIWSSSDPSIVSVDENGRMTAHAIGVVTITAKAVNNKKAECVVRVTENSVGSVTSVRVFIDGKDATDEGVTLENHKTYKVIIKTTPEKAVYRVTYGGVRQTACRLNCVSFDGTVSQKVWKDHIEYTEPKCEIETIASGTDTLTISLFDMNNHSIKKNINITVI